MKQNAIYFEFEKQFNQMIKQMPQDRLNFDRLVTGYIMELADVDVSSADEIIYDSDIIEYCYNNNTSAYESAKIILAERSERYY